MNWRQLCHQLILESNWPFLGQLENLWGSVENKTVWPLSSNYQEFQDSTLRPLHQAQAPSELRVQLQSLRPDEAGIGLVNP